MPNYKKLAKTYEKNILLALERFISIPSVYDAKTAKEGQPYGANVRKALEYFGELGKQFGFNVDYCDGYCTELSIGEEGPLIGIYGHSDVVPADGKWETKGPFQPTLKDGKIIGRGAIDDKGPLLAAFFATKLLKDNGLIKGFRVKIVSGGDEERGSSCLRYYFEKHGGEAPKFGFTPDADWPLIYAEKGIRHATAYLNEDLSPVIAMNGGTVSNAVCASLLVTLPSDEGFVKYLKEKNIECDISTHPGLLLVTFKGKTAHGSTPEKGKNAAIIAFSALGEYYKNEKLLKLAKILGDSTGASFGGDNVSKELGPSTFNYGVVNYGNGTLSVTIDYRFGEEAKPDEALARFKEATGMNVVESGASKLLIYDKKSPLVSLLMKAYKQETHKFFDKPLAIGGGTYAKEAPNTVAFGAEWKGHEGLMHSPNEFIYVEDLMKDVAIYARAIYLLGTSKK